MLKDLKMFGAWKYALEWNIYQGTCPTYDLGWNLFA